MKQFKTLCLVIVGQLVIMQQALAGQPPLPCEDCGPPPTTGVPEIDGAGAILALGLVAGVVALLREKYFHK